MAGRNRTNPLALAVLITLYERPMHPYEVASTLRRRNKHESVKLNYGSLYAVVESLERRRLVTPLETRREGKLPARTVYSLTEAGRIEMHDWLSDLISSPSKEYPSFEAALSFLPALPPAQVVRLLDERALRLEVELIHHDTAREIVEKMELPRLFWVEGEFRASLRRTELEFVRALARDIRAGDLDGTAWWNAVYADPEHPIAVPAPFIDPASSSTPTPVSSDHRHRRATSRRRRPKPDD